MLPARVQLLNQFIKVSIMKITKNDFSEDFQNGSAVYVWINGRSWTNDFESGCILATAFLNGESVWYKSVEGLKQYIIEDKQVSHVEHLNRPVVIPDVKKINVPHTVADNLANAQFTLRTQRGG